MELKEILESERIREAKKGFNLAFQTYLTNRQKALEEIDEEALKKDLRRIKEYSIKNLSALKAKAIENLKKQGVQVFEAKDSKEAKEILLKLIPEGETIVKSKSNVINEIGIEDLEKRNEIIETDCGDFLVQICKESSVHPVTPALHLTVDRIVRVVEKKFGVKLEERPEEIVKWVRSYLREKISKAKIGLTGANVISADGGIFIIENEGNISLVSRLPEKHIIVASIDKIVPSMQDAITICKALAIYGTGVSLPTYINVISSPSKTADIQKQIVYGAHGPKEVYLILLDNGRSKIIEEGLEEILYCINCGACLYFCPVYRQIFDNYGYKYFGGRGVSLISFIFGIEKAFERGLFYCTTCSACKEQCPLSIDIPSLIRKVREIAVKSNLTTKTNFEMIENLESVGNPFGETIKEKEIPDKLYCC
ncbi:MAG: LUD domain-containing protein [Candidatus Aenigmarchaeota archaeon]|nr:LUD domain-containing protein [Candidatus Aenigmarchaeota archaeon]